MLNDKKDSEITQTQEGNEQDSVPLENERERPEQGYDKDERPKRETM
jgi:hypothetical protein